VQISNPGAHPLMPGRSGAWGILFIGVGMALTIHGLRRAVRVRRWRTRPADTQVVGASLIVGLFVIAVFILAVAV
jgi:hypothetical protein